MSALWDYMSKQHGLNLLDSEIDDLVFRDDLTITELVALFYAIKIPPKKMEQLIENYVRHKVNMTRDCICKTKVHEKDPSSFPYGENIEYDKCVNCGKIHNLIIH